MSRAVRYGLGLVAAAAAMSGSHADAAGFFGLGDLAGGAVSSRAWAISSDGSTIVGESVSASGTQAFRWTQDGGMVGLGDLAGGAFGSVAYGVSADGSVVVGSGRSTASGGGREAFRWTQGGGMAGLGDLGGGRFDSVAFGVSADGGVVVGAGSVAFEGSDSVSAAFRWTSADGLSDLNPPSSYGPGAPNRSVAYAVSADGSVIAGRFSSPNPYEDARPGRWTSTGGWSGYPGPSGIDVSGQAMALSADGSVLVGSVNAPPQSITHDAFRWQQGGGSGFLPGEADDGSFPFGNSVANAVTSDGAIVVGTANAAGLPLDLGLRPGLSIYTRPFVWDAINGYRPLQEELIGLGLDLSGWILLEARGISGNGSLLTGTGINPAGQVEAWVAMLGGAIGGASPPATVPEPSTMAMVLLGIGAIATARRRLRGSSAGGSAV